MLKGKTVAPLTLGCKVNQYETDGMIELLKEAGMTAVSFEEKADVYLINTCSVTNMADKKSRQSQEAESGCGCNSSGLLCAGGKR